MATLEERLAFIEHEQVELKNDNAELKKTVELQTIAIGALVNKAALERLNEKNDKIFDALMAHDQFTNAQLAELREHQIELDGKFVGLQTETRQGFTEMHQRFDLQDARFEAQESRFDLQDARFEAQESRFEAQDRKIDQILLLLTNKPEQNT